MQEEKVRISRSLGVTDKEKLIQRALDFAMSVSLAVDSGLHVSFVYAVGVNSLLPLTIHTPL